VSPTAALWASVFLTALAQICLRKGASQLSDSGLASWLFWRRALLSCWIWGWGVFFVIATALWVRALSGLPVSYAVPLLGAGYILVAILSRLLLKEAITRTRWAAIIVIAIGVVIIASN
jgi:drug/metabolite transporter (DMT)-like permease